MGFRDIKAFIKVANQMSFTKNAEHSYCSQPSLSEAVKRLEAELDVILFNRSTRRVETWYYQKKDNYHLFAPKKFMKMFQK